MKTFHKILFFFFVAVISFIPGGIFISFILLLLYYFGPIFLSKHDGTNHKESCLSKQFRYTTSSEEYSKCTDCKMDAYSKDVLEDMK